jgi:hypothetical protein
MSDALDIAKGRDLIGRKVTPLAGCPSCKAPLISTMVFARAEFYCLECGQRWGFLNPTPLDPTPELDARYEALKAEWDKHAAPYLRVGHWWMHDCDACAPHREYHCDHATPQERAAHRIALDWLKGRAEDAST